VIAVVLALGAVPAGAVAHTMPRSTAMAVAKRAVANIKRESRATSGRVISCERRSPHQFVCRGEERYKGGANRCTFDITVRYTSPTSRKAKYAISHYYCA
jgi:hypothetical protein